MGTFYVEQVLNEILVILTWGESYLPTLEFGLMTGAWYWLFLTVTVSSKLVEELLLRVSRPDSTLSFLF